jgi:hypothetical protein
MHRARRSSAHGLVIAMIVGVMGLVPVDTTADGQFTFDPCSCDLNHDHFVGLADIPLLASDYYSGTNPARSDINRDRLVNLLDVVWFARGYYTGATGCP